MKSQLNSILTSGLIAIALLSSNAIFASDRDKEKRWADQISDSLLDGDAVYLNDGDGEFLAIDTRADDPKETGLIIIHGIGIHPDWETIIQPLRVQLASDGWNTLSLQMPILGNDATGKDYEPLMKEVPARIDAGIRYLAKSGSKKVIIIAHSMGTRMTNYYLARKKVYQESQTETPITAYVAIGMNTSNSSNDFNKIKIPVFDLLGEKDLEGVVASAPLRAKAAMNNKNYKQQIVAGAGHFFEGQNNDLVKAVSDALVGFK
jgi:dienelactone hydrolase